MEQRKLKRKEKGKVALVKEELLSKIDLIKTGSGKEDIEISAKIS